MSRSYLFVAPLCACSVAGILAISAVFAHSNEPGPGGGGGECTNECCNVHATPGCSNSECEAFVCEVEPLCCQIEWDLACVMAAADLCGVESPSDCCNFLGPPGGCSDPKCEAIVCAADPFCCDTSWDTLCGFEAQELCGDLCCCNGDDSGLVTICHIPPGNPDNAHTITISLNALAAHLAHGDTIGECPDGGVCPPSDNDCCLASPDDTPGCNNNECCEIVCAIDPFCCETNWDRICAGLAEGTPECKCPTGCPPSNNDCCVPSTDGTVGCNNAACCDIVCAADPFCCGTEWDITCAMEAQDVPECNCAPSVCPVSANDCCQASPTDTPGCNNPLCCDIVCAADPFCCDTNWDRICAGAAEAIAVCDCPTGCPPSNNDCCVPSPDDTVGCNNAACCDIVCAADPFCCGTEWDSICATAAQGIPECNCALGSNCCIANGGLGCDDEKCEACVCALDAFCCDVAWDGICAAEAADQCAASCPCGGGFVGVGAITTD